MKTTTNTKRIQKTAAAAAFALGLAMLTASCGGGSSAYTPADTAQAETPSLAQSAQASIAEILDGPAVTQRSNMVTIIGADGTSETVARTAEKGAVPSLGTLKALIRYDVDSKLIVVDVTFPNGLPVKSGDTCGEVKANDDNDNENDENDHIIVKITKKDGTQFKGFASEGAYTAPTKVETGVIDPLDPPMVRGAYTVSGNVVTLKFADLYNAFPGGAFDDVNGMRMVNRSEKCIWGRYTIDIKPAVETITTTTKPAAGASADSSYNAWYQAPKAFDGDYRAWWVGAPGAAWNLYYTFPAAQYMDKLSVNFYSADYVPAKIAVWTSLDGYHWTKAGTTAAGDSKPVVTLKKQVGFIWFQMSGAPAIGYPLVRDVDWTPIATNYGAYAEPGANDDYYFPSNAFDNNANTWWVGKTGAAAWDVYYGYTAPKAIGAVSVKYFSDKHAPAATALYVSNDGVNWTQSGAAQPAAANITFTVGATAQYYKINMTGAPVYGAGPLVQDIIAK